MRKFLVILMSGLLGLILAACSGGLGKVNRIEVIGSGQKINVDYQRWLNPPSEVETEVKIAIIPHHLLVKSFMEKFYKQLADKNNYQRIVILAPNHFGYGFNFIQVSDVASGEGLGEIVVPIDMETVKNLDKDGVARLEPKLFEREHGIYTHYPFIEKYFPEAKVVPIIIKREATEKDLDELVAELKKLDNGKILYLASLDFTHYTDEESAVQNDLKMLEWLGDDGSKDLESALVAGTSVDQTNESVAIDSPEALYVIGRLADGMQFGFWARTSSLSMINGLSPLQNTSHIFGYYFDTKEQF